MSAFEFLNTEGYENSFCGCLKDPVSCLLSYCCLPCIVGHMRAKLDDQGSFDIWSCLCAPIGAYRNRRNIQERRNITEAEVSTMCGVGLLGCCAVTQDYHEMKAHLIKKDEEAAPAQPAAAQEPQK